MTDELLGGIISGGSSALGSLAGGLMNMYNVAQTNKQNYLIQKEQWRREDTAYERLVDDLQKAGFSKNIVSGVSGGSPSSVSYQQKPQDFGFLSKVGDGIGKGIGTYLELEDMKLRTITQQATYSKIQAEISQIYSQMFSNMADVDLKLEELKNKEFINWKNNKDKGVYSLTGNRDYTTKMIDNMLHSNVSGIGLYNGLLATGSLSDGLDKVIEGLQKSILSGEKVTQKDIENEIKKVQNSDNDEKVLFDNVNAQRKKNGLPPLTWEDFLKNKK